MYILYLFKELGFEVAKWSKKRQNSLKNVAKFQELRPITDEDAADIKGAKDAADTSDIYFSKLMS